PALVPASAAYNFTVGSAISALVPSKRPLAAMNSGDAVVLSVVQGQSKSPNNLGDDVIAFGDAVASSSIGGSAAVNGGDELSGKIHFGPRKRGRQSSSSPVAGKRQQLSAKASKGDAATDEMEDGEEPEDGEVFEDEELANADGTKSRANEDVVMDSGKVKHE
ncbi:hypothetical protein LPJ66_012286, partial [Kickxella alabastrina]